MTELERLRAIAEAAGLLVAAERYITLEECAEHRIVPGPGNKLATALAEARRTSPQFRIG